MLRAFSLSVVLAAASASFAGAQGGDKPIQAQVTGHIFRPVQLPATPERIAKLKLPPGFRIEVFAEGLDKPRMLAAEPNGNVYVTRRGDKGDVLLLRDRDKDGKMDPPVTVAKIPNIHGIAIRDGKMYLAAIRQLFVALILPDGTIETPKEIYGDLPDAGQHPNRTIAFSPQGELFVSVGSTCNECPEPNKESATMLIAKLDGKGREIFASGLRNTIGFDWNPDSGALWGMDHGIDWLGDDSQEEELNEIVKGAKYGWPFIYETGKKNLARNPMETEGLSWDDYAKTTRAPALTTTAHSAPMAMLFYRGTQFPAEYRGSAFIALHGSWNRGEASGYKVVRVKFKDGKPAGFEDFLTGFFLPAEKSQFGRPCGLAMTKDGALLVSDDGAGMIYRISYGPAGTAAPAKK